MIDGARHARPEDANVVRILRGSVPLQVQVPMDLQRGDRVETGAGAYAVIRWPSGSEVFMRPHSSGEVGSIRQALGEFFVEVRGIFAVEAEFVRAGARGTAGKRHVDRAERQDGVAGAGDVSVAGAGAGEGWYGGRVVRGPCRRRRTSRVGRGGAKDQPRQEEPMMDAGVRKLDQPRRLR